jgi:hypothetical protein
MCLYIASGADFRSGAIFDLVILSALAGAMIWTARRIRGWTSYTDAFFPLLLLHWGHGKVLLWGWMMHIIVTVVLMGVPLLVIVRQGSHPPYKLTRLAGFCILLLPLCSANGLAFVPALACWLGYLALVHWRSPHRHARRRGLVLGTMAMTALLLVPLYFVHYVKYEEDVQQGTTLKAIATTTLKFVTLNFLPVAKPTWPFSGLLMLGLLILSGLILVKFILRKGGVDRSGAWTLRGIAGSKATQRKEPSERARALGLFFYLGAIASLALGFGKGRAYRGDVLDPYWVRHYWIMAVPVFFYLYFVWLVYSPPRVRFLVPRLLFAFLLVTVPYNMYQGLTYAQETRQHMAAFEQDLLHGEPVFALVSRHANTLCPTETQYITNVQDDLARRMGDLRNASIGIFRYLQDNPAFDTASLPVKPAGSHQGTWKGTYFQAQGKDSYVEFSLPKPRYVYCIRVKYAYPQTKNLFSDLRASWKNGSGKAYPEKPPFSFLAYCPWANSPRGEGPDEGQDPVIIDIRDTIDAFRLYPDNGPCAFTISEITLWVPLSEDGQRQPGVVGKGP